MRSEPMEGFAGFEAFFSRRCAKALGLANNNSDPVPELVRNTIQELGKIRGLTPDQVPAIVIEWLERTEARWMAVNPDSYQDLPDGSARNHNTILRITFSNHAKGGVREVEIDLSLLSDDELEEWRDHPDGYAEILFRLFRPTN